MKTVKRTVCFLLALSLCACVLGAVSFGARAADAPAYEGYIVKLAGGAALMPLAAAGLEEIPFAEGCYLADDFGDVQAAIDAGLVEYIEPNYILELLDDGPTAPDDEFYAEQWALGMIDFPALYASGRDGQGVAVAVIDTGVNIGHEDLAGLAVTGCNFLGDAGIPGVTEAYYRDQTGHGTFVTGVIAAQRDNGTGIAGITDGVDILALRCFSGTKSSDYPYTANYDGGGGTVAVIVSALGYAVEQGADVINMSFGGTASDLSLTLAGAIQNAAASGAILVAAAGNGGKTAYYWPASFDPVVSVGAVAEGGGIAGYSQHNDRVDVSAPGSGILGLSGFESDGYVSGDGTSFAAPVLSALAAIAKQADGALDTYDFHAILKSSVSDAGAVGYDTYYGWGIVDAGKLLGTLSAENAITYVENGGTLPETYATTYRINRTEAVTLPEPAAWDEHIFRGWYDNAEFTGAAVSIVPAGSVGPLTYYAKWEEAAAPTVAEGCETRSGTAAPGSYDGLTPAAPYTADMAEWFTGTVTAYIVSGSGLGIAAVSGSELTYIPAAADAGGTVAMQVKASNHGSLSEAVAVSVAVADIPPSRSEVLVSEATYDLNTGGDLGVGVLLYGNALTGLSVGAASLESGTDYYVTGQTDIAEETVTLRESFLKTLATGEYPVTFTFSGGEPLRTAEAGFTLTVQDTTVRHTVTFMNGASEHARLTGVASGATVTLPAEPSKNNYTFKGWFTEPDGAGTEFTAETPVTADIAVYAYWEFSGGGGMGGGGGGGGGAPAPKSDAYDADDIAAALANTAAGLPVTLPAKDGKSYVSVTGDGVSALAGARKGLAITTGAGGMALPARTLDGIDVGEKETLTLELALAAADGEALKKAGVTADADTVVFAASVAVTDGTETTRITEFPDGLTLNFTLGGAYAGKAVRIVQLHENADGSYAADTYTALADSNGSVSLTVRKLSLFLLDKVVFGDLREKDWYYDQIQYVVGAGLFSGVSDTAFDPGGTMTRAMLVTALWRLNGVQEAAGSNPFSDLKEGAYYYDAVLWAYKNGIISGYGNGRFGPDDPVTREQMVTILWAYAQHAGIIAQGYRELGERFTDADDVSSWAEPAFGWAVDAGLVSGTTGTTLSPQNTATRAEVATILTRYCKTL